MPNQRRKDKKKISVWMTEAEQKQLEEAAKEHGYKTLPDFLRAVANGTIKTTLKVLILLIGIAWLTHSPMDCSGEALASAVGTGATWWGTGLLYVGAAAWQIGGGLLGMFFA